MESPHVGKSRFIGGRIRGTPVSAVFLLVSIAEVGAAYGHVIGCLSPTRDANTVRVVQPASVAAIGIGIARGNENRYAFRHRLLKGCIKRCIERCAAYLFAFAVAHTHDGWRRAVFVEQVEQRNLAAEGGRVRARSQHDRCVERAAALLYSASRIASVSSPFAPGSVQLLLPVGGAGWICVNDPWRMPRKPKYRTEQRPICRGLNVRVFEHHDSLALSCNARAEQRIQVVDLGQIARNHQITGSKQTVVATGVLYPWLVHGMRLEVVQCHHTGDRRGQRCRELWIAHVGDVLLALHIQVVNLRVEGFSYLTRGSGKVKHHAVRVLHIDLESMRLQDQFLIVWRSWFASPNLSPSSLALSH